MRFKFIHAADIHLDSPLRGLERYDGAPVEHVREAARRAFERMVELAIEEQAAFVLIAGDVFDGDWKDYNTGLYFVARLARLREAQIPVYFISGNHDAQNRMTRELRLPDNTRRLAVTQPESVLLEDLGVAIHGQGFASSQVTEDLAARYPEPLADFLNIGLLHTSLDGRPGHDPYAPCSLERLLAKGYAYWALGHVHQREVVHEEPWIVFPGNIQGRHIREQGPKGCTVVTVDNGRIDGIQEEFLDVLRWHTLDIDVTGADTTDAAMERLHDAVRDACEASGGPPLALRVTFTGRSDAHPQFLLDPGRWTAEVRAAVTAASGGMAWVEKAAFETAGKINVEALLEQDDALAGLLKSIEALAGDTTVLTTLAEEEFQALMSALNQHGVTRAESPPLSDVQELKHLLQDVREILVPRILPGANGS